MAYRKFQDRNGNGWEVRTESRQRWRFEPLRGSDEKPRMVTPPLYAEDPFELSEQELQKMLDEARPAPGTGSGPTEKRSPFLDL